MSLATQAILRPVLMLLRRNVLSGPAPLLNVSEITYARSYQIAKVLSKGGLDVANLRLEGTIGQWCEE